MSQPTNLPRAAEVMKRRVRELLLKKKPFYRAYPYALPVDMGSANHRGVVSLAHRFFFNRVPKAANSSIVKALAMSVDAECHDVDSLKDELTKPSHLTKEQVADFSKFYKFTVVRNPYSRTLSAYLDLIVSRGYYKDLNLSSFREFLNFIGCGALYENIHWAPQTSFLLLPVEDFDFIGRFEALRPAIEQIAGHTGIPIDMSRSSHRPHATDALFRMVEYYSDDTIAIVKKLYSEDFAQLGYSSDFSQ